MNMTILDNLGIIAGSLTTGSFVPQLVRIVKEKTTKEISLGMFLMSFMGLNCWLVFGILLGSKPIIVSNTLSIAMVSVIILYKLKYK